MDVTLHSALQSFCGSDQWTRHGLARCVIYSEGAKYLAEHGDCYWLLDAVASYFLDRKFRQHLRTHPDFSRMHFWNLTKEGEGAVLTAVFDKGCTPVVSQEIEYTDFLFPEDGKFQLYVGSDETGLWKIFLPSEY